MESWMNFLTQINIQIKKEFCGKRYESEGMPHRMVRETESLLLQKQYILSTGISKFMSYLDQLATNDEEEIVRKPESRIVTDMYVED